jgi:transketolase
MKKEVNLKELEKKAWQIRLELLRMFSRGKVHHFGGSFSCVELMTSLYFYKMNYSAENKDDPGRDRFIMSKGHSVPTQYVIFAMLGIIPMDELKTIKRLGTRLQGHPDILKTPGLEAPTGSLGQGLSYANGIALAAKMDGLKFNMYLILGDGEVQEGQIWEAAMTTNHYHLNNICVIVDRNRYQSQGEVDQLMRIEPLQEKWESFGWQSVSIDGHDIQQVCQALDLINGKNEKPLAIIADTVKGKGISFIENTYKYHNLSLTEEEYLQAEKEILAKITELANE